jgi:hypothetical protein
MTQLIAESIGRDGCYFLSILRAAEIIVENDIDAIRTYPDMIGLGYMREDCYLLRPEAILSELTGKPWLVRKTTPGDMPGLGEIEILRFERIVGRATLAHFVLGDGQGRIAWDPYGDSAAVREGKLASKRIFSQGATA